MKIEEGLTYDDVLMIPQKNAVESRSLVNTSTYITKNVKLNIPMVSIHMATVTESDMAIAMASEGGIGFIHRFMPIPEQVAEVRKVKRTVGMIVEDPLTCYKDLCLGDAIDLMESNHVTSLFVVDSDSRLIGIFTKRDYSFETDMSKSVDELMTPKEKLITGSTEIKLEDAKALLIKHRIEKIPLVNGDNNITGLVCSKSIRHLEEHKLACRDRKGRLRVGAAIGIRGDYLERAEALVKEGVDILVVDVAHAHSDMTINAVKELKKNFEVDVLVGNIISGEAAKDLIKAGADGLKVGIGNGTICTTRLVAGAGMPQLTAVLDVVKACKKQGIPVSNEGGIATPGNFAKAIAAGCNAAIFGSVFAGSEETPGPIVYRGGKRYKHYHGSTSYIANVMKEAREKKKSVKKFLKNSYVEGVESLVPYKGKAKDAI
ncbi:IMP dehydrogenase, partial [archaeon]|nr:IMP dehydrogenase [archaeon]